MRNVLLCLALVSCAAPKHQLSTWSKSVGRPALGEEQWKHMAPALRDILRDAKVISYRTTKTPFTQRGLENIDSTSLGAQLVSSLNPPPPYRFVAAESAGSFTDAQVTIEFGPPEYHCSNDTDGEGNPETDTILNLTATLAFTAAAGSEPVFVTLTGGGGAEEKGHGACANAAGKPLADAMLVLRMKLRDLLTPTRVVDPIDVTFVYGSTLHPDVSTLLDAGYDSLPYDGATLNQPETWERAISYWEDAIRIAPENEGAYANLAGYQVAMGNLDEAIALYEKAMAQPGALERDRWVKARSELKLLRSKVGGRRDSAQADSGKLRLDGSLLVLEFKGGDGVSTSTAAQLTRLFVSELQRVEGLRTLTLEDVQTMLDVERQRDLLGCTEASCMAEIGGALGADYVMHGQLGQLGSRYSLSVTVMDSKKSRVAARNTWLTAPNIDLLARDVGKQVREIVQRMLGQSPP